MDYLKQKSGSSQSAYDQISDLLLKLFLERPPQRRVYSEFEALTNQLLDIKLPQGDRLPSQQEQILGKFQHLQIAPQKPVNLEGDDEDENKEAENPEEDAAEEEENVEGVEAQDLQQISRILRSQGINFTQLDAFRLQKAIYDLAVREERKDDKFQLFGKVGPYWVLRSETGTYPETPEEENQEEEDQNEENDNADEENDQNDQNDKDDELQQLEDQWNECKTAIEAEKEAEAAKAAETTIIEGDLQQQEQIQEPEPEIEADLNGDAPEDLNDEESEKPVVEGEENKEEAAEPVEEKEELKSNITLEDEFQPETKVPKRLNTFQGATYPLKKIQKIPEEENDGLNKYVFFAALDINQNDLNQQLFTRLQHEYEKLQFRKKNNLKQAKSKFSKLLQEILKAPLFFKALPAIKPEQMRAFQQMPYQNIQFTGDLTFQIKSGLPIFQGTEAHLLKCAICRIQHAYTVVPKGLYVKEEEENEEDQKKKIDQLEQETRQKIKARFELLKKVQNQKLYEVMIQNKNLWSYSEDEAKLELTAAFAELNEEFRGYENFYQLLSSKKWVYLYPRINGQGRCLEVNDDDYENINDPEPCEQQIIKERIKRLQNQQKQKKQQKQDEKNKLVREKQAEFGKKQKKFAKWLEEQKEKWSQEEVEDEEINLEVQEDEYDDTQQIDKPDVTPDLLYEELQKYYTQKLWRKLRVFQRPVAPWDASIVDNRVNVAQPELFIENGQLDKTRVDFKQKCLYNVDEALLTNELDLGVTKLPLWVFQNVKIQQIHKGQQVIVAKSARCAGAINVVSGVKYNKHCFLYFGGGVDNYQFSQQIMTLPDMCVVPNDILEECEIEPQYQRMEHDVKMEHKRRHEEQLKKAAEAEAAGGEEKNEEDKDQ